MFWTYFWEICGRDIPTHLDALGDATFQPHDPLSQLITLQLPRPSPMSPASCKCPAPHTCAQRPIPLRGSRQIWPEVVIMHATLPRLARSVWKGPHIVPCAALLLSTLSASSFSPLTLPVSPDYRSTDQSWARRPSRSGPKLAVRQFSRALWDSSSRSTMERCITT